MANDNETVGQVALSDLPLAEQIRIIRGNYRIGSGEFDALDEAADVVECNKREIAELKKEEKRKKKYEYAIKFDDGDIDCVHSEYPMHSCYKLVRREVGEWKEVKE